jgi:hypothetical protein
MSSFRERNSLYRRPPAVKLASYISSITGQGY